MRGGGPDTDTVFPGIGIPLIKMRRPDRLIIILEAYTG